MNKTVSHCLAFSPLLLPVIGEITPRKKIVTWASW